MSRLVNVLLWSTAALAVGAGAAGAEAPSQIIGLSNCDAETYECQDRRIPDNGSDVVFALRAEFTASPTCAGLFLGEPYEKAEERWVVWLGFRPDRPLRAWTLKPPDHREWLRGKGTVHEIVQTVCGIANGRGGAVLEEFR